MGSDLADVRDAPDLAGAAVFLAAGGLTEGLFKGFSSPRRGALTRMSFQHSGERGARL
jgi:hypothetical protein